MPSGRTPPHHSAAGIAAVFIVLVATLGLGCGSDSGQGPRGDGGQPDGGDAGQTPSPLTIRFAARVGDQPFACGASFAGLGADDSEVTPADLRFYVQDVALVDQSGAEAPVTLTDDGRWQQRDVALLDFEDKTGACANGTEPTNDTVVGTVAPGQYRGLRFTVGVPFALNHQPLTDAKPPLDLTALFWSWNLGHLFLKAEASAAAAGGAGAQRNVFAFHLGSIACEGKASEGMLTACARPNRATVELSDFDPETNQVVIDFAEIFAESSLQSLPGCHSFAGEEACVAPFSRVGVDWSTGQPAPALQKVFRAE